MEENKISEQLIKKIARGGMIILFGGIIGKIIHFGLHILLGRGLGAGPYGLYVLGLSIFSIAYSISTLGLHQGVVRFTAIHKGKGDKAQIKGTLISALSISLLFSIFVSILLFIFSQSIALKIFNKPELTFIVRVFSISIPFHVLMIIVSSFARGLHKMKYSTGLINVFHPGVNIFLVGIAFLIGFKLNGALFALLISTVLSALLGLYLLRKIFPEIMSSLQSIYQTRKLLRFSLPLLTAGIALLFMSQTDRLMLGWLSTSTDVGIYNAASVIALQITLVVSALAFSFSPIIADLYNRKKTKEMKKLFQTTARWGIILSLPIALVIMIFSKNILLLFGSQFTDGWQILTALSIAYLIVASRGLTTSVLIMSGKQNLELLNTLIMVGINIPLNYWGIKLFGAFGASVATAICISLLSIIRLLEIKFLLKMQPYSVKCLKPLFAGLIIFFVGLLVSTNASAGSIWVIYGCGLMLLYGGILYLLGIEKEDLVIIRAIKNKLWK